MLLVIMVVRDRQTMAGLLQNQMRALKSKLILLVGKEQSSLLII